MAEDKSERDLVRNAQPDPFDCPTTAPADPGNATCVRRAHLPVPPPDEDDDDDQVRRPGSGGGNIDPDDEDGSEDDDDEDDDDDALALSAAPRV